MQALKAEGLLPQNLAIPAAKVQRPKKASLSASGISLTSAFAFPLAAASSKYGHEKLAAVSIADLLKAKLQQEDQRIAEAVNGHINFHNLDNAKPAADSASAKEANEIARALPAERLRDSGRSYWTRICVENSFQKLVLKACTQDGVVHCGKLFVFLCGDQSFGPFVVCRCRVLL